MLVASHRGLYSVGLVLAVGVACCMFVSVVMLPAILTILANRQPEQVESQLGEAPRRKKPAPKKQAAAAAAAEADEEEAPAAPPMSRKERKRNRAA